MEEFSTDRATPGAEPESPAASISESRYQRIVEATSKGIWEMDALHRTTYVNRRMAQMLGYTPDEMLGRPVEAFMLEEDLPQHHVRMSERRKGRGGTYERRFRCRDGRALWTLVSATLIVDSRAGFAGSFAVFADITEQKAVEWERETTAEFLRLVNEGCGLHELVERAVRFFEERSECDAVGIRLREGEDYPYFEARGFPPEFQQAESSLCARDLNGQIARDEVGNAVLECMCGNVICGRFDPALPFFTAHGSFWTNCTTELLASTTEEDRQSRTRNRCNGEGYESVALIPLLFAGQRLGLLQLNDGRRDRFTPATIALWERLAGHLAVALSRCLSEEALRAERDSVQRYLDVAGVLLVVIRADQTVSVINRRGCEILGWSAEELAGRNWFDLCLPPDTREGVRRVFTAMMAGEVEPWEYVENTVLTRRGEQRIIGWHNTVLRDDRNRIVATLSSGEDVTARRRAEEELRKAHAILDAVLQHTYMLAAYLDAQFNFIWVNASYAASFRHEPEFFAGKNHFDLCPNAENQAIFERVVATGEPAYVEARPFAFPDQPERGVTYWDWSLVPVREAEDRIAGLVFTLVDVTKQIRVKEAQRAGAARHRSLIQGLHSAYAFCRILEETDQPIDFQCLEVNQAFETFSGLRDAVGRRFSELVPRFRETAGALIEVFVRVARTGTPEQFEFHYAPGDAWLAFSVYSPETGAFIALFDDITDRVRAGEEVRRARDLLEQRVQERTAQLAATVKELEAFSYSLSHDLRGPLRAIVGFSQILADEQQLRLDASGRTHLERIQKAGVRMSHLIDSMLMLSRLSRQQMRSEEEYEGLGSGLATVQRVIHRHGGRIWAEAEVGRGAKFDFTLATD